MGINEKRVVLKSIFKNRKQILAGLCFLFLLTDIYMCWKYFYQFTFYDSSAELVLGELLAEENALITSSWYYSTEIRILYSQIINRFLFEFISDYRTVNTISIFIHLLLLEGSLYYFIRNLLNKRNSTWFWVVAVWVLVPYNALWRAYVLFGVFYIPHFVIILLTLGMYFHFIHLASRKKKNKSIKVVTVILSLLELLLSFLAGMGGIRHLEILYLPFFGSVFLMAFFQRGEWNYWKPGLFLSGGMLLSCGIGYIFNHKILASLYYFDNFQSVSISTFTWAQLEKMIQYVNMNFGFIGYTVLMKMKGLASISSFIIWLLIFFMVPFFIKNFKTFSAKEQTFIIFAVIQWILNWFIIEYTDMFCSPRYFMPQILSLVIVFMLFFRQSYLLKNKGIGLEIHQLLSALMLFFLVIQTINGFIEWPKEEKNNPDLREIVSVLKNENYTIGYGDFFDSGAIPTLSNGTIDMIFIDNFSEFTLAPRLMKVESGNIQSGDEKTFILITQDTYNTVNQLDYIQSGDIIYYNDSFVLIGYESLDTLWNSING